MVDLESPLLFTKILPQSCLGSGEEDFQVILPHMGTAAFLFNGVEPFDEIVYTDGPM